MSMKDVECPYCGKWQEICHDDGYGYEEDGVFEQECSDCDKIFTYGTTICFHYEAYKAPCLNGGEHKWVNITGWPSDCFKDKYRCDYCDVHETIKGGIND